jgi:hypothetical protein
MEMVYFPRKLDRRQALAVLGATVGAAVAACGSSSPTSPDATSTTTTTPTTGNKASCVVSPAETRGPYPDTVGMIDNTATLQVGISVS